jgi:hypothetical protein
MSKHWQQVYVQISTEQQDVQLDAHKVPPTLEVSCMRVCDMYARIPRCFCKCIVFCMWEFLLYGTVPPLIFAWSHAHAHASLILHQIALQWQSPVNVCMHTELPYTGVSFSSVERYVQSACIQAFPAQYKAEYAWHVYAGMPKHKLVCWHSFEIQEQLHHWRSTTPLRRLGLNPFWTFK